MSTLVVWTPFSILVAVLASSLAISAQQNIIDGSSSSSSSSSSDSGTGADQELSQNGLDFGSNSATLDLPPPHSIKPQASAPNGSTIETDHLNDHQGQGQPQPSHRQYAVLVDCGSSGTRARIYHWPANASASDCLLAKIEELRNSSTGEPISRSIRPGLASVRNEPELASDYMRPLMQFASAHVPHEAQARTPVYFLGTAGMRMLSDLEQRLILEDIARDVVKEFEFKTIETNVITGTDEGAYRWLAGNAAASRLGARFDQPAGQQSQLQFLLQARSGQARLGVLEMGGASAQVTYELTPRLEQSIRPLLMGEALEVFQRSRRSFKLPRSNQSAPSDHNLLSVSFTGFGSDAARNWSIDLLVRDSFRQHNAPKARLYWPQITLVVDDPCLALGAEEKVLKPLELIASAHGPLGRAKTIGYDLRPGDETFNVRLIGRGNFFLCRQLLIRMVILAKQEKTNCQWRPAKSAANGNPCESALIATNFVPWTRLQFIGLGELYYSSRGSMMARANQDEDGYTFSWPMMQLQALRNCATHFELLLRGQQSAADYQRIRLQCFKATWVLIWLQFVLLMPPNTLASDLQAINKLNGQQLDWTRGALMAQLASVE